MDLRKLQEKVDLEVPRKLDAYFQIAGQDRGKEGLFDTPLLANT